MNYPLRAQYFRDIAVFINEATYFWRHERILMRRNNNKACKERVADMMKRPHISDQYEPIAKFSISFFVLRKGIIL